MRFRKAMSAIAGIFGLVLGGSYQWWLQHAALVALKLRPELVNLTFWEAIVSNHFMEWLWFINRPGCFILNLVIVPILSIVIFQIMVWTRT